MAELTGTSYYIVSLPSSAVPTNGHSSPETQFNLWSVNNLGITGQDITPFKIPSLKIGTLDNLISQSEELGKIDTQLGSAVAKVADILSLIYDGNTGLVNASKRVNDKSPDAYIKNFQWNTSKYRIDKPISELIELITNEAFSLDTDVRTTFASYSAAKTNLSAVDRKQTGDLSVKSLHDIVNSSHFILDSDHLQTVLVAVPKNLRKEFLGSYETLVPFVVPRSSNIIAEDNEYILFNVSLFKKYVPQFVQKCREQKWTPREFKFSEGLIEEMRREQQMAAQTEHKLRGEVVRLAKTAYSDIFQAWFHLKAIRIFVESVLRYGLPPTFVCSIIKPPSKQLKKVKETLISQYGYLGGNAFATDKKGRVKNDSSLNEYGSLVDTEYEPFAFYSVEIL